jgi:hypothetical protein
MTDWLRREEGGQRPVSDSHKADAGAAQKIKNAIVWARFNKKGKSS